LSVSDKKSATVYFAKWILVEDELIENGAIRVVGNQIDRVGYKSGIRESEDSIVNLGDTLLLPGFINLHTRFEESSIRGALSPFLSSHTKTIEKVSELSAKENKESIKTSIKLALRESLANGITTSLNSYKKITPDFYDNEPGRFLHIADISTKKSHSRFSLADSASREFSRYENTIGITPDRLYTLTPSWLKEVQRRAAKEKMLFVMHLSESSEDVEAFSENSGALFELLNKNEKWYYDRGNRGSGWYAVTNSLLPRNSLIINPGYSGGDEFGAFAANSCTVAISPRYSTLFNHRSFTLETALNRNLNLTVVTETPALSHSISLLDELFELRVSNPLIPAIELIHLITKNPARALKLEGRLGVLKEGAKADLVGVKISALTINPVEEAISGDGYINFVAVDGEDLLTP
jgi:cytosine/adenosine deaminase-related metal-dependent hydrolase